VREAITELVVQGHGHDDAANQTKSHSENRMERPLPELVAEVDDDEQTDDTTIFIVSFLDS
jgi:hypothetical protein